ncbi:MAG: TetR family transcriptional regulator, partial [Vicinamibacteria bacterium]
MSPRYIYVSECQDCTLPVVPVEKLTPERRRQQTRDVLIEAATEVFARRGFEGAALEEIAETAGFTRGAIYKNFAGKEDLFFAVTDR